MFVRERDRLNKNGRTKEFLSTWDSVVSPMVFWVFFFPLTESTIFRGKKVFYSDGYSFYFVK